MRAGYDYDEYNTSHTVSHIMTGGTIVLLQRRVSDNVDISIWTIVIGQESLFG